MKMGELCVSLILTVLLSIGTTCFAQATSPMRAILFGDVNDDGRINTADARQVLQYAAGQRESPTVGDEYMVPCADANQDGKVNTTDARLILQYTAGKVNRQNQNLGKRIPRVWSDNDNGYVLDMKNLF